MRLALVVAAFATIAVASPASAADSQLACAGDILALPNPTPTPVSLALTVEGGLGAPGALIYAWSRPELSVPLELKALSGDTLSFHGLTSRPDGAVVVADAQLNRSTLALVLKIRQLGGQGAQEVTLQTACRQS